MSKNGKMRRIGLSGTNWTGKTATITRLAETLHGDSIEVISLSSIVARCPYPMGKDQTLDGSSWMVEQVSDIVHKHSSKSLQLFDRTPLDILGFTCYVGYRSGTDEYKDISSKARDLLDRFDRVFLVRPRDQWLSNVSPSVEEAGFALLIDFFMESEAKNWNVSLVELPWGIEKRLQLINDFLNPDKQKS